MDAHQASQLVKEYFFDLHGQWGVIAFQVESVLEQNQGWEVTCSFLDSVNAGARTHYDVHVNSDGKLGRVQKLSEAKGASAP